MSMTIAQMREEVARLYSGEGWRRKVAAMPDMQVLAIYKRQVLGKSGTPGGGSHAAR